MKNKRWEGEVEEGRGLLLPSAEPAHGDYKTLVLDEKNMGACEKKTGREPERHSYS